LVSGVLRAAVAAFCVGLALAAGGGAARGAAAYTGPVPGVPWSPAALGDAVLGVPYSATVTALPAGAVQVAVVCNTHDLPTSFPAPPIGINSCGSLPPGLHATAGASLTIAGTPTTEGSYSMRFMAVWQDASGSDFYTLQTFGLKVTTTSASPPCHCSKVGVQVTKVSFSGSTASVTTVMSLQCSGGTGRACKGAATFRAPAAAGATASWTGRQLPGDDKPVPLAKGQATVGLSCYAPCGGNVTVQATLTARGPMLATAARRARSRWSIAVVPACAGTKTHVRTLVLQFDASGKLDARRSKLTA
jgi:hypothetical protein